MARIVLKSFGCSANIAEGEMMSGLLQQADHTLVSAACSNHKSKTTGSAGAVDDGAVDGTDSGSNGGADVIVLNVCTVKGTRSTLRELKRVRQDYPESKIVLTGCVTRDLVSDVEARIPNVSFVTNHKLHDVASVVSGALSGEHVKDLRRSASLNIAAPRKRSNPVIGIVPVCSGCLDACSFCSTKLVKGHLRSYPQEKILAEVRSAVRDGCKEIWLTGQDAACYGFDFDPPTNLAELLRQIVAIPGFFRVRIGMGNPRHIVSYVDELIDAMRHPKVFQFIHLPVQSGSSSVLNRMNRKHSVDDFWFLVRKMRDAFPRITISTDVIAGFPGETEEEFTETLSLLRVLEPPVCNIARFSARRGTRAAQMDEQLHGRIKKDRTRILSRQFFAGATTQNKTWIGWEGTIVVSEHGHVPGTSVGRNFAYKPIAVRGDFPLGSMIRVRIVDATKYSLHAEAV